MADSLEIRIMKALAEYTEEIEDKIESTLEDIGGEAVKMLKSTSPKRTGKYRRSWTFEKTSKNGCTEIVIYNAKYGSLTHLLENGHRTRNKKNWVATRSHIEAVEQWAIKETEKRIKEVLKG